MTKLDSYRPRVQTFKERRPHKALDFEEVSRDDLEDLLAYIGSLERPYSGPGEIRPLLIAA